MSALLISAPRDATTGAINVTVGTAAPNNFSCGIPYESDGSLAVDTATAINNYHMGLPLTANGRIAITLNAPAVYGSGAAPVYGGRIGMAIGTVSHFAHGVAYLADDSLAVLTSAYQFNGSDMYASFPDWTPNGLPYEVKATVEAFTVDGNNRKLVGRTGSAARPTIKTDASNKWNASLIDVDGSNFGPIINPADSVTPFTSVVAHLLADADITTLTATGQTTDTDPAIAGSASTNAMNVIGGYNGGEYFRGTIKDVYLTDNSPFQRLGNRPILTTNNSRYVAIPSIDRTDDWEVEFSLRRVDKNGTSVTRLMGNDDGLDRIQMYDSAHVDNADDLRIIQAGATRNFTGVFAAIAQNQDCHVRITMDQNGANQDWVIYVDGESVATNSVGTTNNFEVTQIGAAGGTTALQTGAIMGDVIFTSGTAKIKYAIDDASGTTVLARDENDDLLPSKDGTVTPGAAWGEVAYNSRHYPMNEGTGATIADILEGGQDGTIQNYDADYWSPYNHIRQTTLAITNTTSTASAWDWAVDSLGTTLYAAAGSDGIWVFDITDPVAPVQQPTVRFRTPGDVVTDKTVTDIYVLGAKLIIVGRSLGGFGAGNETGIVAVYDLTTPTAPSWEGSYQPADMNPKPKVSAGWANNWYQGVTSDGTDMFLASQRFGLSVIDISTPSAPSLKGTYDDITLKTAFADYSGTHDGSNNDTTLTDTGASFPTLTVGARVTNTTKGFDMYVTSNTSTVVTGTLNSGTTLDWDIGDAYIINENANFYWETSKIAYYDAGAKNWVFCATHGNGVIAVDVTNPAAPTNPQLYEQYDASGIKLRARDVVVDATDGFLYSCNNTSTGNDDPERGLLTLDISDPEAVTNSDWNYAAISDADNSVWDGAGDRPIMGLIKSGNYCFLGNGNKGIAVFDVSSPSEPYYMGTYGQIPSDSVVYAPYVFTSGGNTYIYHAGGLSTNRDHTLYVDRINIP